jgi:proteasome lid subunit RPN8/RPN11
VHLAWPLPNTTEEGPRRRFLVRAADYLVAEQRAGTEGRELMGFYHSHPDHPARPSQFDLDHAWPVFSYVIISVADGRPGDITSWRLADDRSAFAQETLAF